MEEKFLFDIIIELMEGRDQSFLEFKNLKEKTGIPWHEVETMINKYGEYFRIRLGNPVVKGYVNVEKF